MKNKYTLLVVPRSGGRFLEFHIGKIAITGIILIAIALLSIFSATLYLSTKISSISLKYYQIEGKNRNILEKLNDFESQTEDLKKVVLNLKEQDQEIRKMLGIRSNKKYFPVRLKKK